MEDQVNVNDVIDKLLAVRGQWPGKTVQLSMIEISYLAQEARDVMMSQPVLLELMAPMTVVGDLNGQFYDLLRCFEYRGFPPEANYLFLGNYVDFGKQSIETICLLLCYKVKYPENFFLLRGKHESASMNRKFGFYDECKRRYNIRVWKMFTDVFNCMPIAAIIDDKIMCCSGGLSPDLHTLDQIRRVMRPTDVPDTGLVCDLLWAAPAHDIAGWGEKYDKELEMDISFTFGPDVVQMFLKKHDLDLIVRGSDIVEDGYEFFANRSLVTLFSAPNYKNEFDNAGAMMLVDDALMCSFQILKPAEGKHVYNSGGVEPIKKLGHLVELQAALRNGSAPFGRSRLLLTGEGRAGKSAFARSLTRKPFVRDLPSTVGAETTSITVQNCEEWVEADSGNDFERHLAICIGRDRENGEPSPAAKGKRRSLSQRLSDNLSKRLSRRRSNVNNVKFGESVERLFYEATPTPVEEDVDLMARFPEELVSNILAGDKRPLTFSLWDLGGQKVFYALHHIFLTRCAVYVVLFDMEKIKDPLQRNEAIEFLQHWLNSITLHATKAPIFLVGTRKDKVSQADIVEVDLQLRKNLQLSKYKEPLQSNDDDGLCFWPVDNTLSGGKSRNGGGDIVVERLRTSIETVASRELYVTQEVPLAWTRLLDLLYELDRPHVTLSETRRIAQNKCGMTRLEQVDGALSLMHELGMLLYFPYSQELREVVVLSPQWLIDTISLVIRDFSMHPYGQTLATEVRKRFFDEFELLQTSGIVSRAFLEFLWANEDNFSEDDFVHRRFLISLMERMMLLCRWNYEGTIAHEDYNKQTQDGVIAAGGVSAPAKEFLVPALVRQKPGTDDILDQIHCEIPSWDEVGDQFSGAEFYVDFGRLGSFLPTGFFERLVCIAAQHSRSAAFPVESREPVLMRSEVLLSFGDADFRLTELSKEDRIRCVVEDQTEARSVALELLSMVAKINEEVMNQQLQFALYVVTFSEKLKRLALVPFDAIEKAKTKAFVRDEKGAKVDMASLKHWANASRKTFGASQVVEAVPLPSNASHHVFISHYQANATDACARIALNLRNLGFKVWYDMSLEGQITADAMEKGVKETVVFMLFLSKSVLTRPFVQLEVRTALNNQIPILLVHEEDRRMAGFAEIGEMKAEAPADLQIIFDKLESIPIRRRAHEERAFVGELAKRIKSEISYK